MDDIPDEQPTPRWVALYELGLLLRTASGRVHPLAAYLGWLHDAGFGPPERHRHPDEALAVLLVARKPRAAEAGTARSPADQGAGASRLLTLSL